MSLCSGLIALYAWIGLIHLEQLSISLDLECSPQRKQAFFRVDPFENKVKIKIQRVFAITQMHFGHAYLT